MCSKKKIQKLKKKKKLELNPYVGLTGIYHSYSLHQCLERTVKNE